jgi:hypothetical protein
MAPGLRRSSLSSSELVRLLAEFAQTSARDSNQASFIEPAGNPQSFAERLGLWLNWTDAISLSSVLASAAAAPAPAPAASAAPGTNPCSEAEQACLRVRSRLAQGLASAARQVAQEATPADFAPLRRHCLGQQRVMEEAAAALRAQLRGLMGGLSPALARLAALDAVMDSALAARERAVLATVVTRLEERHARLRRVHAPAAAAALEAAAGGMDADAPAAALQAAAWLDEFCADMHGVLMAELELRLQPAMGLLDAMKRAPRPPQQEDAQEVMDRS